MFAHFRRLRGFGTWELLLAVAVVASLASLAAPQFVQARRSSGLAAAAGQMLGALHLARSSAILRNVPTAVCLSADGRQCMERTGSPASHWLVFHDDEPSSPVRLDPGDEPLRRFELPPGMSVRGSRASVVFWPAARAGSPATFLVCHERLGPQGRAIIVSRTGRPRSTGLTPAQGSLSCAS